MKGDYHILLQKVHCHIWIAKGVLPYLEYQRCILTLEDQMCILVFGLPKVHFHPRMVNRKEAFPLLMGKDTFFTFGWPKVYSYFRRSKGCLMDYDQKWGHTFDHPKCLGPDKDGITPLTTKHMDLCLPNALPFDVL